MHLFRIRKFKREDGCTHVITSHPGIFFRNSSIHTFQLCYRLGKETRMNCYKKIGKIPRNEKYLTFKRKPLLSCVWNRTTLKYSFHNHTHTYTHEKELAYAPRANASFGVSIRKANFKIIRPIAADRLYPPDKVKLARYTRATDGFYSFRRVIIRERPFAAPFRATCFAVIAAR